jgi:hypothetical protein
MVAMLVVLSQRAEVPKGDGWMPGSLLGRPHDAAYPVQLWSREIDSRVIYEMVINFLGKWSPLPWPGAGGFM